MFSHRYDDLIGLCSGVCRSLRTLNHCDGYTGSVYLDLYVDPPEHELPGVVAFLVGLVVLLFLLYGLCVVSSSEMIASPVLVSEDCLTVCYAIGVKRLSLAMFLELITP